MRCYEWSWIMRINLIWLAVLYCIVLYCIQEMFSHRETILEIKEVVRESEHGAGHKVVDVRDVEKESTTPHHIVIGGSRSQYYNLRDVTFKLPDGFFEVYD